MRTLQRSRSPGGANRKRHGEIGDDAIELDAIDRTGRHKMGV